MKPIESLKFEITFTSTGKTLKGDHTFETGLSSITGKNEAGKSLRLELIRYALFGTEALRAGASTYKKIDVYLKFRVGDKLYKVERSLKKAHLRCEQDNIATGTTPVNNMIKDILGYDLEVFDVANACLQGQIEAMTDKTPSERKQMVDRTIGLDAIDRVMKHVAEDITTAKKAIDILNDKVIQSFEAPVRPDVDSEITVESLEAGLDYMQKQHSEKQYMLGSLNSLQCEDPGEFVSHFGEEKLPSLTDLEEKDKQLDIEYAKLGEHRLKLKSFKDATAKLVGKDIAKIKKFVSEGYAHYWNDYDKYQQQLVEKPAFEQSDINNVLKTIEVYRHNLRIEKCEEIECPSCTHKFRTEGKFISLDSPEEEEQCKKSLDLLGLADFGETIPNMEKRIRTAQSELDSWEKFNKLKSFNKPELDKCYNEPQLLHYIEVLEQFDAEGFDAELAKKTVDSAEQIYKDSKHISQQFITLRRNYDKAKEAHAVKETKYDKYLEFKALYQPTLDSIGDVEELIKHQKDILITLKTYEGALKSYEAKQEAQAQAVQTKAELEVNLEMYGRIKKALAELKPKVKTYLLPSLNKVASNLLSQMTNGQRNVISVNEDFEIDVDGQPVKTLSGSGKAVANLAVRIGLGMVLTNKVFSVFLADEIDAAMDDERAAFTAECLRNLTKTINQIILVSHKQPDADHQIIL